MTSKAVRQNRGLLIGFGAVLAFAWFCYAPAISGSYQLDDFVNLGGLEAVRDASTAMDFVFSGIAGPTGRPLTLASFVFQSDQWVVGPAAFLRVNILIHLVNAVLLAACLYQLSLLRAIPKYDAGLVAIAAAGLWVLMPLLVTASVLIVQRMTTLSAMFMLLGLNGIVVKSHGGADDVAFQQAIHTAMVEVDKRVPEQIRTMMAEQEHHEVLEVGA